jgi:hypothetical protein
MPRISQVRKAQSDPGLKEAGVEHTFLQPDDDEGNPVPAVVLTLRSAASNKVRLWELKRYREQRQYYENDNIPPIAIIDKNEVDKLAEAYVVAWNFTRDDDSPEPCTVETVRAVMAQMPDLRRDALEAAGKHDRYRLKQVAAIAKNSEPRSPQVSTTAAAEA